MSFKKFFLVITFLGGVILFSLPFWPDEKLHLIFCDVGQGDAILVKYQNLQAIIDGGPSGVKLSQCLSENLPPWDRDIELMILTHPESDHLTGLIDVLERYNVDQIVVNSVIKESEVFWEFYRKTLSEEALIYSPKAGDQLKIGPINFSVLWPKEKIGDQRIWLRENDKETLAEAREANPEVLGTATVTDKVNETSIVLQLSYDRFDTLLTGDIGFETETKVDFPQVEILKIPHHGSHYSTSQDLANDSNPQLAIISVGKNSFGHPTAEVLDRLRDLGIETLRTDQKGTIEIISDGKKWWSKTANN